MGSSKNTILCFGGNSHIAKAFFERFSDNYNIINVTKKGIDGLTLDFSCDREVETFIKKIDFRIDGILFCQGINPRYNLVDTTYEHSRLMMDINVTIPLLLIKGLKNFMNENCCVIFLSSIAKRKGSYDPTYAAAKSAITGLIQSLANFCPKIRFNQLTLGLVEDSPVQNTMTPDFVKKHTDRMQNNKLVQTKDVVEMINQILFNESLNRADINLDRGYI
ncbi:MAG: SDR family oxidoreductase [Ferruginibacter sp.]